MTPPFSVTPAQRRGGGTGVVWLHLGGPAGRCTRTRVTVSPRNCGSRGSSVFRDSIIAVTAVITAVTAAMADVEMKEDDHQTLPLGVSLSSRYGCTLRTFPH
jgi:hypothetical protein